MGIPTNFPDGLTSFGIPLLGGGQIPVTSGQYMFVCSNGGTNGFGDGYSLQGPVASLVTAMSNAVAARGDVIVLLPGHAESVATATAMPFNKSGVTIVGIGNGALQPTITFTTANTATIPVSAANISITGVLLVANFLSIAAAFTLAAAANFNSTGCTFKDTSNVLNFLNIFKSTGAANTVDGLTLVSNKWYGLGTTSVNSFLLTANDIDRLTMIGNYVKLARTATAAVMATVSAGVLTAAEIRWNIGISQQTADTGGGFINVGGTTSTGVVSNNYLGDLSTTDLFITTTVGFSFFNNFKTGVISASGYLLPAADS